MPSYLFKSFLKSIFHMRDKKENRKSERISLQGIKYTVNTSYS